MAYEPKDMTGRIYDNKASKTNEKQPDFTGTINVHGELIRVAAWYYPPSETSRTGTYGIQLTNKEEHDRRVAAGRGSGKTSPATETKRAPQQAEFPDKRDPF